MNEEMVFHRALALPTSERAEFLASACKGNESLRQRIEQLLQSHDDPGSFMAAPPAGMTGAFTPQVNGTGAPGVEAVGTRIGAYKLLQQIGEGGMGVVYMAEQEHPVRRRVALKIIKPGMDTAQVVARFEAERQALALMDHQNIAKVLDVGATESGRPYFVMELVNGIPITSYCDQEHLTPRERLELFVPVCQAIQHAHQKGIIHRDLKPSNVLVALYDGKPVPKVIDFGVAKATSQRLTERTMFTEFGQVIGTLEYMAPEQAERNALDVDTRSDVYSLGVMLYELLTGSTPLEKKKLHSAVYAEMMRMIREDEPAKPSTRLSESGDALPSISAQRKTEPAKLSKLMRGELDWIVMKALEKDRGRRYETANGFARDIQRYLADDPVEACPPSARYKLRKFARKNRRLLATSGAFVIVLLLGVAGLTAGLISVNAERKRTADALAQVTEEQTRTKAALTAETKARAQTRNAINAMTDVVMEKVLAQQQTLGKMEREFLGSIVGFYEQFAAGKADSEEALPIVASGQMRVAKLRALLGDVPLAISGYREAAQVWDRLSRDHADNPNYRHEVASCHHWLGVHLISVNKMTEAEHELRTALALREKLRAEYPAIPDYRLNLAATFNTLGTLQKELRQPALAESSSRRAIELYQNLVDEFRDVPHYRRELATSFQNFGTSLFWWQRWPESESFIRQSIALLEQLPKDMLADASLRVSLAGTYNSLGSCLGEQKRQSEAVAAYSHAIAIQKKLVEDFPGVPHYRRILAGNHANLGLWFMQMEKFADAEVAQRQAMGLQEQLIIDYPKIADYRQDLAANYVNFGTRLRMQGQPEDALIWYGKAIPMLEAILAPDNRLLTARFFLGNVRGQRAFALGRLNRHAEALADWDLVMAIPDHPDRNNWRINRAVTQARLGQTTEPIATAAELTRGDKVPGGSFANAASVYAIVAANAKTEASLKEQYALDAITLLRRAKAIGFFDSGVEIAELKKDADYDGLRQHEDFRVFLAELETAAQKDKP